jgi:acyl transferase domain-containing protein/NADPH:quinone reductase-like Zn-dependent oxidoreductase/surfactin synthase thioesterase subunit
MKSRAFLSLQTPHTKSEREPLAVVGIGCRFPGGIDSPTAYWAALLGGTDAIRDVPEDRWLHSRFHDTNPDKAGAIRNARGGFIDGVDQFDAEFFGYFPTEAQRLDPQQRLLLEVTHEAMEDAGLRRDQLDGTRTSVYVGSFMYDYLAIQAASEQRDEINPYVAMGTTVAALSNRISYDFNLKGPSISIDTACSSSLVAVHLACRSLWGGEADMAIAAGVNLMLRPESSIMLSKAGFLSPDQYCKAFDIAANGYVRGEGVGVVILKRLSRALADGDSVYAVVRGTGVNQDGYLPEGFTVPNINAQIALLKTVYGDAGVDPHTVDFVEAHGTGTPVGDPIEALALGTVLGRGRDTGTCLVGSVKTNLGHLEGGAGIAGFIKGALTARHGIVPPNLHFHNPNPDIDWASLKLTVPTQPMPLKREGRPVTVGVNSFGAGGTNAHVVLQSLARSRESGVRGQESEVRSQESGLLYVLSAANRDSLRASALRHADFLDSTELPLDDVAYSAFVRRSHYPHRLAVVGRSTGEIAEKLRCFADGKADRETLSATIVRHKSVKVGFIFSGQGGHWAHMGQQLMQSEPVFAQTMSEIDSLFHELAGWSLLAEIAKNADESRIDDTIVVQPALMAIQIALVKLYDHYGVRPAGVMGHSVGEVAAAFAAGALSVRDAVQVIYHRSQAQHQASGKGGMLAVGVSVEEGRKLIGGHDGRVSIAAVNGPEMLTLSGDTEPLQHIAKLLESRGIFNRPVRVQVAYHSHHIEPIRDVMLHSMAQIPSSSAVMPLYSTVTGRQETGTHLTADYWFHNARQPVLFTDALRAMIDDGFNTFIEIGPHPLLVGGAEALFEKQNADAMIGPAMTRREPERVIFLQSLARLAARGIDVDATMLFGADRRYVRLPKHPWQHQRHWFEAPALADLRRGRFEHPFLKRQTEMVTEAGQAVWEAALSVQKFPYLRDHQVDGEIVFPATAHLELAWAVADEQYRHEPYFLENLQFDMPLILPDNSRHLLDARLEIVSGEGDYRICSRPVDASADTPWTKHSSGRINTTHDRFEKSTIALADLRQQFHEVDEIPVETFYATIRGAGLDYGEKFRCIQQMWHRGHEVLARLQLPDELVEESHRNVLHPALLDSCLHALFADVHCHGDPERIYLPHRIGRVRFDRRAPQNVWSYVRITRNDEQYLCTDTLIFDDTGELIAEVHGLDCKRLAGAGARQADSLYEGCYEYRWIPSTQSADLHGRILDITTAILITDVPGAADDLADRFVNDGIKPRVICFVPGDSFDELLADVPLDRRTLIVFAPALSRSLAGSGWNGLADCPFVPSLLQLAQTLHKREGVPRLNIVTNSAAGVGGDRHLDLGQAILHGIARVIKNECPNIPLTVIDLSDKATPAEVDALYHELLHSRRDRDESEIALRGNERFVRQLIQVDRDSAEQSASRDEAGCGGAYRADLSVPGVLDQIVFRQLPANDPGENEVEIAVEAAALNFKDIINGMGILPAHAVAGGLTADRLGLEVAGRVLRTGRLVEHVQPGDAVIARVSEGFCGRVTTPAHFVVPRPVCLTPQQGAAIPIVFITAWYSLYHLARIAPGETVLIHSAAGGVGGAAIQLAQRAGAIVIATAGTREKRAYLGDMGVQHVFDSRSLDFYDQVMDVTGGRGVDVVVNSLTGRFIAQSLKCLAPFGRFIELGKSDIYRNNKLNLERLGENISYFVVDVDRLAVQKPDLHRQILTDVIALFERGELRPQEVTEFPISKLPEAMKFMTRAAYRGKIVLNMQGDHLHTLPPRHAQLQAGRSYLISGGASGFGLEIARWMASRGARHLVLVSRSGPKSDADRAAVKAMRDAGVKVLLAHNDLTDLTGLHQLMDRITSKMPPLAGVIHGAAVMDDATIPNMDIVRFERVFGPKAQGAWNLHEATLAAGANLDFFVMLSSISSVLGFYGQVNYVAANFFQDALAHYRRQRGLPGTAVNLGVMGQYAGLSRTVNDAQDVIGLLESHGMLVMPLADVLAKVEAVLIQQPVQRMTGRFDWALFRKAYPHLLRDARFVEILSDTALARGGRKTGSSLRTALVELEPAARRERLEHELAASLARTLDAAPDQLDVAASIENLGLDSLMLTQLRNWILRSLDINLPLIKLLKGPSIVTLAAELLSQLDNGSSAGSAASKDHGQNESAFTVADLEGVRVVNPWLIRGCGSADAPCRLVCFHPMGVGVSFFTNFLLNPPKNYDILAVQTPGRETRAAEPVLESVASLVDQIVPMLLPLLDRPTVFWGHSFGGVVAAEVIRGLGERHQREPHHLVVSGTLPLHLVRLLQARETLLKAMVTDNSAEYLISLSRYVDDAEFIKAILPLMRRDYPILKNYRYQPGAPLDCSITAFAARQDDMVYTDEIREWSQHTRAGFDLIEVDGDHWFVNRNRKLITARLEEIAVGYQPSAISRQPFAESYRQLSAVSRSLADS